MNLELRTYDELNQLIDTDPLGLRDYAWAASRKVERLEVAWTDAKEQVRHVADDLDKAADALKQIAANHNTDIPALLEELNRLRAEARMLRTKVTRQEQELAELDRENATLAGRANLAEEQLAAATLEGQL